MELLEKIDSTQLGEYLRRVRKSKRLRMQDLAEPGLSESTISNLERGKGHVHPETILRLMTKLEIQEKDLLSQLEEFQQDKVETDEQAAHLLFSIEHTIDFGNPDEGLKQLNEMRLSADSLYLSVLYFLKGKAHFKKGRYEQARSFYREALRLSKEKPVSQWSLPAGAYNELSRISFYESQNLGQALHEIEKGLEVFDPETNRKYVYITLLINKMVYLEKLDRSEEAIELIEEHLWPERHTIQVPHSLLTLYEVYGRLLKRTGRSHQSIIVLREGLNMARMYQSPHLACGLWEALGSTYYQIGDVENAERCYHQSLDFRDKVDEALWLLETHIRLGHLYMEQNEWLLAGEHLHKALELARTTSNALKLTRALYAWGRFQLRQGHYEEALTPLQEAMEICQTKDLSFYQPYILYAQAQAWEHIDSSRFHEILVKLYQSKVFSKEEPLDP